MSTFKKLGVQAAFIKGLSELNIKTPTEIQESTIPVLLQEVTDFIGLAQTGTGKTAAFGLPLLHHINADKKEIQVLVLAPTRELVQQIKKQLFKFTKYCDDKIFVEGVYGGEKIDKQIQALKRTTHVVVATPGRLIDLINRGDIDISKIHTLVLDEADEMLSMGFKDELDEILTATKGARKTWLFSATMPAEVKKIVTTYLSPKAVQVAVNKNSLVNSNISHHYIKTSIENKLNTVMALLDMKEGERGIIFCRTKAGTQNLVQSLKEEGFSVGALEGDMGQRDRDKVMRSFKNQAIQVLISTDVSARGIDVNNLGFVIHHQLPEQIEYYTHRSGRTARAGKKGSSIALVLPNELHKINTIEKALSIAFKEINL